MTLSIIPLIFLLPLGAMLGAGPETVRNLHYTVVFDSAHAARGVIGVSVSFDLEEATPVHLSMPAWTPGAYVVEDFARNVTSFSASGEGGPLSWGKVDQDTWRVFPRHPGEVEVEYDYSATQLECHATWAGPDFALFNGTALFLYPDPPGGPQLSSSLQVTVRTEPGWGIVNSFGRTEGYGEFQAADLHDLFDTPTFVGVMEVDSMDVGGRWYHLATYPVGSLTGEARDAWWSEVEAMIPPMESLWGEVPFDTYTTLIAYDEESPGGEALEHRDSHLGVYSPSLSGPDLSWVTSHEILHAWNVKRVRPVGMVPYDYSTPQPSPLLWVAEGLTEYYAHVALVRAGLLAREGFYGRVLDQIELVESLPPVALADASLSTWVAPVDGTHTIYYEKGALAGLLLDILIRHESANARSLDDVMRDLYWSTYKHGRGFSQDEFWVAVSGAAGGRDFGGFAARYIAGREPFPLAEVLPLGGLVLATDTFRVPSLGASLRFSGENGEIEVLNLQPGRPLERAGAHPGDILLRIGDVQMVGMDGIEEYRARFGEGMEGNRVNVLLSRDGDTLSVGMRIELVDRVVRELRELPGAGQEQVAIRNGILGIPGPDPWRSNPVRLQPSRQPTSGEVTNIRLMVPRRFRVPG